MGAVGFVPSNALPGSGGGFGPLAASSLVFRSCHVRCYEELYGHGKEGSRVGVWGLF